SALRTGRPNCASSGQLEARSAAFVGSGEAALLSRASESERSAVPVEQEIAVDNPQRFGPEVDFADVVWLEAELDSVSGTRIEFHRFARRPEDLQCQPHGGRGICSAEGEGEALFA